MADYRIYALKLDGHVAGPPVIISADTDEQAMARAASEMTLQYREVWQGARLVASLAPMTVYQGASSAISEAAEPPSPEDPPSQSAIV